MKSTEGYHLEAMVCNCPYCGKENMYPEHKHCYEIEAKATKEVCKSCGKTFYLKGEQ